MTQLADHPAPSTAAAAATPSTGEAGVAQPLLEVSDGRAVICRAPLGGGRHLVIGRAPDAGLRLEGSTISRHHAEVFRDPFGRWWVRDLGSRNGVKFNGQKVAERALQPGVLFQIGHYRLVLRVPQAAAGAEQSKNGSKPNGGSTSGAMVEREIADIADRSTGAVRLDESTIGHLSTLEDAERPRISGDHLSTLMRFGRELLDIDSPAERLVALCRLLLRDEFHGTSAMVFRLPGMSDANGAGDEAPPVLSGPFYTGARGGRFAALGDGADEVPYISRNLVRHLREHGRPVLASNVSRMPEAIEMSISPEVATLSAVACPVRGGGSPPNPREPLDVLYVTFPPQFGTAEWLAVAVLAAEQLRLAESALVARRQAEAHALTELELQRARQIQMRLVPRRLSVPGFDIAVGFEPCRWVGGDYVDVAPAGDGRVLLAVADVCGKGMPAALVATSLRTTVRTGLHAGMELPEMLVAVRGQLSDCLQEDTFVTMAAVVADPGSGGLRCVNAGHPAPFICAPDGSLRELPCAENFPLGIMVEPIECRDQSLAVGEMLVMFTDGIPDLASPSGAMLGARRFAELTAQIYAANRDAPAAELSRLIGDALNAHRAGRCADDDQTFLLAKRV